MLKFVVGVLGLAGVIAPGPVAAQAVDPGLFERGEQLYLENCALCHQDSGEGDPPSFPALRGNDLVGDTPRVVRNIQRGEGTMPPFPDLTAEEISAVTNYIRGAWSNSFGGVTTDEVAALLEDSEGFSPLASVWEGVFTEAQANRGQAVYPGSCGACHGRRLNGAPDDPDMRSTPPLARAPFLRSWEGRSLATLFEYTRATMPEDNPGSLTDEEYVDVIAYMLSVSGMPAGDDELRPEPRSLSRALIRQQP
jgi:mono/diheme cytochrome c family protein